MCVYIYRRQHRRLGERKRQLNPIGKSVLVSFRVRVVRACVRACEAVRVREGSVASTLEAWMARSPAPAWVSPFPFVLLYARVLSIVFKFEAPSQGF